MPLYPTLVSLHDLFSKVGLGIALVMLAIAVYIGLIRHGDVNRLFRRATFVVVGFVVVQSLIGLLMYGLGGRPVEEVHLIYGLGATLALPFFIYVEVTAKKRPAMGSYIWGYALLAGIFLRAIMTGG